MTDRGARVLLVEDDPDFAFLTTANLEASGHTVHHTTSMHEALDLLEGLPEGVDVVVLDLGLPDINGLAGLSAVDDSGSVPVVVLTGDSRESTREEASRLGAVSFLVKGEVSVETLDETIRNAVLSARAVCGSDDPGAPPYESSRVAIEAALGLLAAVTDVTNWAFLRAAPDGSLSVQARCGGDGQLPRNTTVELRVDAGGELVTITGGRRAVSTPTGTLDARTVHVQSCSTSDRRHGLVIGWSDDVCSPTATGAAAAIRHTARMIATLHRAEQEGIRAARRADIAGNAAAVDALTGLGNRRAYDGELRLEESRCARYGHPSTVFIVDLDRLKFINDNDGHAAGDRYLRDAATALQSGLRGGDTVFRIGGDEFAAIASHCADDAAEILAERLSGLLERHGVDASIGWATRPTAPTLEDAAADADKAMYAQKLLRRAAHAARLEAATVVPDAADVAS